MHLQTSLVSVEGLSRLVDPSQLTSDLGGSLEYDHVEWTELRLGLEEFLGAASQLLAQLDQLEAGLNRLPEPQDVDEARKWVESRSGGARTTAQDGESISAPFLGCWRSTVVSGTPSPPHRLTPLSVRGGACSSACGSAPPTATPPLKAAEVGVTAAGCQAGRTSRAWRQRCRLFWTGCKQLAVTSCRAGMTRSCIWTKLCSCTCSSRTPPRRGGRDQRCLCLRAGRRSSDGIFFSNQMSEWIAHSKDLFVQSLAEVGQSHQHALDLQTQHQHFTANCMVRF